MTALKISRKGTEAVDRLPILVSKGAEWEDSAWWNRLAHSTSKRRRYPRRPNPASQGQYVRGGRARVLGAAMSWLCRRHGTVRPSGQGAMMSTCIPLPVKKSPPAKKAIDFGMRPMVKRISRAAAHSARHPPDRPCPVPLAAFNPYAVSQGHDGRASMRCLWYAVDLTGSSVKFYGQTATFVYKGKKRGFSVARVHPGAS